MYAFHTNSKYRYWLEGKFVHFILVFLITWMVCSSLKAEAQHSKGKMGARSLKQGSSSIIEIYDYSLELFPNQEFKGWTFFSTPADSPSWTAQLQESPEVPWLSISPTTFTSDTCTDVVQVVYTFSAPATPGVYTTTIVNQVTTSWSDEVVTLRVTNTPEPDEVDYVHINPGQTYTYYDTNYFDPDLFTDISCLPFYIPGDSGVVDYSLMPAVSWLTITPSHFTINSTDTTIVAEVFSSNTPGDYSCYEIWTAQYLSWPYYTMWNLSVLTDISDDPSQKVPFDFEVSPNFPNPFNPVTKITYSLPTSQSVQLKVYDVLGREVATLVNSYQEAGTYNIQFDASGLVSGIYYYRIQAGKFTKTHKMLLER
jgi:hypothetical protein